MCPPLIKNNGIARIVLIRPKSVQFGPNISASSGACPSSLNSANIGQIGPKKPSASASADDCRIHHKCTILRNHPYRKISILNKIVEEVRKTIKKTMVLNAEVCDNIIANYEPNMDIFINTGMLNVINRYLRMV